TATNATVSGLTNGISYVFRVAAINAIGTGPYSAPSAAVVPATVPGAPTAVSGTPHDSQVALTWTAPSDIGGSALTGYHVQYSSDGGTTWNDGPSSALTST